MASKKEKVATALTASPDKPPSNKSITLTTQSIRNADKVCPARAVGPTIKFEISEVWCTTPIQEWAESGRQLARICPSPSTLRSDEAASGSATR
jgi:hypothetical protein